MTKIKRIANTAVDLMENIASGFAQMGSMGTLGPPSAFRRGSDADALRSDWERVGSGLKRGIEKAR